MILTKQERKIAKGAGVGLIVGACVGAPFLGAVAGGIIARHDKKRCKND